ncbi:MAG: 2-hydroxyglutaryl-CoA dehydratase [Euryarchaeota archaeon]|nr:2-hydroxyglutaryl-CoA dehydratase [Euryarchaeota archaeon]
MIVGIDVGSRTAKAAYLEDGEYSFEVVGSAEWRSLLRGRRRAEAATGYFRKHVPAELRVTEITTAVHGARRLLGEEVEVIVDIGGQDTKVIDVRGNGFRMNDKCSAGTGAFLELIEFGVEVEELGELHRRASRAPEINSTCSVFAQSEVVSRLVEGYSVEEVVRGVHLAFARRIAQMVPEGAERVAAIGGAAKNRGVVEALEEVLGAEVLVPEEPQVVNAVGAVEYYLRRKGGC